MPTPTLVGHYPYTRFPASKRPIVKATVINSHNPGFVYPDFPFLLDTGADYSLLPHWVCEILGHDLRTGKVQSFHGVAGSGKGYLHSNYIEISGLTAPCDIYIADESMDLEIGLLGQQGFFSQFVVVFDYRNNCFSIYR